MFRRDVSPHAETQLVSRALSDYLPRWQSDPASTCSSTALGFLQFGAVLNLPVLTFHIYILTEILQSIESRASMEMRGTILNKY